MALSSKQRNIYEGTALALLTVVIWSGNYVVARGIIKQVPPVSLAIYRWGTATVCLLPFAWQQLMRERKIVLAHKNYIFWAALTGISIFNTFIYLGGHYTSAINLALIGTTAAPIFVTFMGAIFLREEVTGYRIAGMLICLVGIAYLLSQGSLQKLGNFHFGKGDLLVFISAFSFAVYNTMVKKRPAELSPMAFLLAIFALGSLLLLPFYLYERTYSAPVTFTGNTLLIILYLGIGNSVIGFFCWNLAIKKLGSTATALFANLIPIFSTIEAVLFLGESFTTIHLISGLLVIGGIIVANMTFKYKRRK